MLTIDTRLFEKKILDEINKKIKDTINAVVSSFPSIKQEIYDLMSQRIKSAPEYQSLVGGELYHSLGVLDVDQTVNAMLDAIINGIELKQKKDSITISLFKKDLSEVLRLQEAYYISRNGFRVEWLDWLLTEGDNIILTEIEFVYIADSSSRTGQGVMISAKDGSFRIPPEFSGSFDDNWLTRAFTGLDKVIADILAREFYRRL